MMNDKTHTLTPVNQEILQGFSEHLQRKNYTPKNQMSYFRFLREFMQFLRKDITLLANGDIPAFRDVLLQQGHSPNTVKAYDMAINRCLEFLAKESGQRVCVKDSTIRYTHRIPFLSPVNRELLTTVIPYLQQQWTLDAVDNVQVTLIQFAEYINKDLPDVSDADIENFRQDLKNNGHAYNTIRQKTHDVKNFFRILAEDLGIDPHDPDMLTALRAYHEFHTTHDAQQQQEWLDRFSAYLRNTCHFRSTSADCYCQLLQRFVSVIRKGLFNLTDDDVKTYKAFAKAHAFSPYKIRGTLTAVRKFLRFIESEENRGVMLLELKPGYIQKLGSLPEDNQQILSEFHSFLCQRRYSASTVRRHFWRMVDVACLLNRPLVDLDTDDINTLKRVLEATSPNMGKRESIWNALYCFIDKFLAQDRHITIMIPERRPLWQKRLELLSKKNQHLLTEFWDYCLDEKELAQSSLDAYRDTLLQFMAHHQKDVEALRNRDLVAYKEARQADGIAATSINSELKVIRQFFNYLRDECQIVVPIKKIKTLKIQQQQFLDHYVSKSDFDRLIRATERKQDMQARALLYTLYYTGARISEVLSLPADAAKHKAVTIRGKGNKTRKLLIPNTLRDVLEEYAAVEPKLLQSPYLFFGKCAGQPMSQHKAGKIIKHYAGHAKLKKTNFHAHSFRHGYAVRLDQQGFTLTEIADLLGHANINTTRIYQKRTEGELRTKLDQLL